MTAKRSTPSSQQIADERLTELRAWYHDLYLELTVLSPADHATITRLHRAMIAFRRSEQQARRMAEGKGE